MSTTDEGRRTRLHQMSKGDEHMALSWLADHMPEAFDRAAAYVDRVHAMDARIAASAPKGAHRGA